MIVTLCCATTLCAQVANYQVLECNIAVSPPACNWIPVTSLGTNIPGLTSDGANGIDVGGNVTAIGSLISTNPNGASGIALKDASGNPYTCVLGTISGTKTFVCTAGSNSITSAGTTTK